MSDFPVPLEHLTIDFREVLRDGAAVVLEAARLLKVRPWEVELEKVSLASESMELAVSFSTGEVMVVKWVFPLGIAEVTFTRVHGLHFLADSLMATSMPSSLRSLRKMLVSHRWPKSPKKAFQMLSKISRWTRYHHKRPYHLYQHVRNRLHL
jgi:hypothetical protein